MTFFMTAAMACAGTIGAGIAATQVEELRPFRWLRIGLSLPFVVAAASVFRGIDEVRGYFGLWSFAVLGLLWASPMAHGGSWIIQRILYGDLNRPTGVRADFQGAKALGSHRDFAEAIALTEAELAKDPSNYEGLLLLAELYRHAGEPSKAVKALQTLLDSPRLTEEQRDSVKRLHQELTESALVADLNSR